MPYKLFKQGNKTCVKNSETGENKGCSASREMAVAHMRALYAAEGGAKMGKKELDDLVEKAIADLDAEETLEQVNTNKDYPAQISYMATSYKELDSLREEAAMVTEISDMIYAFPTLAGNILANPEISDKGAAIKSLGGELADRVGSIDTKEMDEKAQRADVSTADKKRAVAEYGNVTYADPENKKYPIDTEKHIRAAWSYINMPRNSRKYSSGKAASIRRKIIAAWKRVIDKAGPPQAAEAKELSVVDQVKEGVIEAFTSLFSKEQALPNDDEESFLVWKEGGETWRWLAFYSNNFRDRDIVPEIISKEAHLDFIENVDKGLAPYPELWLWHVKEWKMGQADMLAWDDLGDGTGFALATGYFNKGCEPIAEWLSTQKDIGVSHGMPPKTVRYDENDPTIIVGYRSAEISPLPSRVAANDLGYFLSMKKEAEMAIPEEKRNKLITEWGMPEELLSKLESMNADTAEKAIDAGLEHKEITEEVVAEPTAETETTEAAAEAVAEEKVEEKTEELVAESAMLDQSPTRKEVADSLAAVIVPMFENVENQIKALSERINELQKGANEQVKEKIQSTPPASLIALLQESVIGKESTEVDGRSSLAKSKPTEKEAEVPPVTLVPFINQILARDKHQ